jgi:hypothetical protein
MTLLMNDHVRPCRCCPGQVPLLMEHGEMVAADKIWAQSKVCMWHRVIGVRKSGY